MTLQDLSEKSLSDQYLSDSEPEQSIGGRKRRRRSSKKPLRKSRKPLRKSRKPRRKSRKSRRGKKH